MHDVLLNVQMILVGLSGGIATGKSTVSNHLKRSGTHVIDCDEIAHDVVKKVGGAGVCTQQPQRYC